MDLINIMNYKKKDILIYEKGKYKFDLNKECVLGHEDLWYANKYRRGSIIIILENNLKIFENIFKYVFNPGISGTPNSGNTHSAVKKFKEEMKNGRIGICLPASNGIDWMDIYINQENMEELFMIAEKSCNKTDRQAQALESLNKMFLEKGLKPLRYG